SGMTAAAAVSRRPALTIVLTLVVVFAGLLGGVRPARAVSTGVVISQIYGGGSNTGATYTNDFIELFNRGAAPVAVTGWSVQYASATGTTWLVTTLSNATIPAGGYFLVQEAAGGTPSGTLPTPDV